MRSKFYNISNSENAILVEDGMISEINTEEEFTDESFDLQGMEIKPGIVNFHLSLMELSDELLGFSMKGIKDVEQLNSLIAKALRTDREWYVFFGAKMAIDSYVTRTDLDELSKEKPIIMIRDDGSVWTLNQKALELCELDSLTLIDDDGFNREAGKLEGHSIDLCKEKIGKLSVSEIKERILKAVSVCNSLGITEVYSDDFGYPLITYQDYLSALQQMSFQNELNIRLHVDCRFKDKKDFASFLDEGLTTHIHQGLYEIGSVILDVESDDCELMYQLANSFNMTKRLEVQSDDDFDAAIDIMNENCMEDNLLQDGILTIMDLSQKQLNSLHEKKYECIQIAGNSSLIKGEGYYGFSINQETVEVLTSFYRNNCMMPVTLQPWVESVPTGKIQEGYGADFYICEQSENIFKIHMTVVDGKVVFEA